MLFGRVKLPLGLFCDFKRRLRDLKRDKKIIVRGDFEVRKQKKGENLLQLHDENLIHRKEFKEHFSYNSSNS